MYTARVKANLNPVILTFMEQMMADAIVMATYIRGHDKPAFMDDHIEHCERTFGVVFHRWLWEENEEWTPKQSASGSDSDLSSD